MRYINTFITFTSTLQDTLWVSIFFFNLLFLFAGLQGTTEKCRNILLVLHFYMKKRKQKREDTHTQRGKKEVKRSIKL